MTKKLVMLSIVLLFTGVVHSLQAQTFKVGDYVDVLPGGSIWEHCMVTRPLDRVSTYGVSCGATDYNIGTSPREIRASAATAEDKRVEAETAAALARQPKGNSVGAPYGTRDPKTCSNRTAPAHGAPSADQTKQYFICDQERADPRVISLVTNVKVQVASAPLLRDQLRAVTHPADLDFNQPVWNIRGSFTQYQCAQFTSMLSQHANAYGRAHNCNATDMPTATGFCYKNTFGEWHCIMSDSAHVIIGTREYVLPPEGN
jgi:hypothetical protein